MEVNTSGYCFIIEELLDGPGVTAERTVRWYDTEGVLKGIYQVPFWEYSAYPNTDLAFDPISCEAYNLILGEHELELRTLGWTATTSSPGNRALTPLRT